MRHPFKSDKSCYRIVALTRIPSLRQCIFRESASLSFPGAGSRPNFFRAQSCGVFLANVEWTDSPALPTGHEGRSVLTIESINRRQTLGRSRRKEFPRSAFPTRSCMRHAGILTYRLRDCSSERLSSVTESATCLLKIPHSEKACQLNRSMQHHLNLKFFLNRWSHSARSAWSKELPVVAMLVRQAWRTWSRRWGHSPAPRSSQTSSVRRSRW
jgi:hypothetical protein